MQFSLLQISQLLNGVLIGNPAEKVSMVCKIEEGEKGSISFLSNSKYDAQIYSTKASAVIVRKDFEPEKKVYTSLIKVDDPYTSFIRLLEEYQNAHSDKKTGIEANSFQGSNLQMGENCYLGAFSYLGNNVRLGNDVKIYPHSYVGDDTIIGDNTVIHDGVKIYKGTIIGKKCIIHAGSVIGSDGFGFAPQQDGSYKAIPQIGNVRLEDCVNIGANTVIDCATMGSTTIKSGSKLDNLIQIAHNVEIGKNTVIAAQSGIAGSSKVGNQCVIAGQVGIVGHITIPNKTTIAAQSGITKTFKEENEILLGSPGLERDTYMKAYAIFKNLPRLLKRIKQLEEKILNSHTPKK